VIRRCLFLFAAALAAVSCHDTSLPVGDGRSSDLAAGRSIYEAKCASCHNTNGDGKTVTGSRFLYANLIDGIWRSDGSPEAIERQIRRGHEPMPKFEGKLTDEEIRQTVAYVVELSRGRAGGVKRETKAGVAPAASTGDKK
jgi:mono/diheme cytochrome c family protein